jgi:hypothetical protein
MMQALPVLGRPSTSVVESESVRFLHYEPVDDRRSSIASSSEAPRPCWVKIVEGATAFFEKLIMLGILCSALMVFLPGEEATE